ncbi:MAG: hypothetical protein KKF62_00830 [Bacteroidetes bacterium]|nr:hypothetical protein [Bacteroidota bacterium]MBU1114264.1 hypothetical protein [Bacteroidota bacterium]MBU1797672.1 hypothetical protein [Bacteroidota bacterium]
MKKNKKISQNIIVVFIVLLILSIQYFINITIHIHILPSGQIISHSHILPFNNDNSKNKSHSHTEDELRFYSLNSFMLKYFIQNHFEYNFYNEINSITITIYENVVCTNSVNLLATRAPPLTPFI